MSRMSFHTIRLAALSMLIVSNMASAQIVQPNKCPGNNCMPGGVPNYPQSQIDVNALASKVTALEQKLTALEAKVTALEAKHAATDGNVTKLMTHTHDVATNFDFSSTVVSDIHQNTATVVIPIGNFGKPAGVAGQPKFK